MKKNPAAVALGKIKSPARARASAENGKKGGRPKKIEKGSGKAGGGLLIIRYGKFKTTIISDGSGSAGVSHAERPMIGATPSNRSGNGAGGAWRPNNSFGSASTNGSDRCSSCGCIKDHLQKGAQGRNGSCECYCHKR